MWRAWVEPIDAEIDEVRIWSSVRNLTEIQSNMYTELIGNEASLAAYYDFNEGTAGVINPGITTLPDKSPNGNDEHSQISIWVFQMFWFLTG